MQVRYQVISLDICNKRKYKLALNAGTGNKGGFVLTW